MKDGAQLVVELAKVKPADDNVREKVGNVDELARSVKELGVIEPLIVTEENSHFNLVAGARRLAAAKKAGLKEVPVIVRDLTEAERVEVMVVENLQREDLSPLEEARGFAKLVELGRAQREIATRLGCSQAHVSKRLALLKLPEVAQKKVDSGGISLEDAQAVAKLDDEKAVERIMKRDHTYQGAVKHAVEDELRKRKVRAALEKAKAKLEKAGVTVLKSVPKTAVKIGKQRNWDLVGPIDPAKHAKEPCHAVVLQEVGYGSGIVIRETPVCTDRKRHPRAMTSTEASDKERDKRQAAAERLKAQREEAAVDRRKFVAELLNGSWTGKAEAELLAQWALEVNSDGDVGMLAERLAGLDPKPQGSYWWKFSDEFLQLDPRRRALCLAIADIEAGETSPETDRAYLAWLEARGFKPRDFEEKWLKQVTAAAAGD